MYIYIYITVCVYIYIYIVSSHLMITPDGLCRGAGLHRLPQDLRWDDEFPHLCCYIDIKIKPSSSNGGAVGTQCTPAGLQNPH